MVVADNVIENTIATPIVARTLERLHRHSKADWARAAPLLPLWALNKLTGSSPMRWIPASLLRRLSISVSEEDGRLLYLLARAMRARHAVEFGASFGLSTIYLAAAVRDKGEVG